MIRYSKFRGIPICPAAPFALLIALSGGAHAGPAFQVSLEGSLQIPPVSTAATGRARISVQDDHLLKGSIEVSGIEATTAQIHEAPTGENGPSIITLVKDDDNSFSVPQDTKLTEAEYRSFVAGKLYINVRSRDYPGGEIRAQLISRN
jgi:hypothetical protein